MPISLYLITCSLTISPAAQLLSSESRATQVPGLTAYQHPVHRSFSEACAGWVCRSAQASTGLQKPQTPTLPGCRLRPRVRHEQGRSS